jgi:ABC-type multidrug transport system fused ATPase/permease subunit
MFTANPFTDLADLITPAMMQVYVVAMFIAVAAGTIIDVIHKKSAKYFSENAKKAQQAARRTVSGGEKMGAAISTITNEVLTSSEFANPQRRMSHLMTMWGFILFVVSTVVMIFGGVESGIWPLLWHVGALSVCVGGYWFWFFIRCDVNSEGHPWYKLVRADLFIVSLLMTTTFALLWSILGGILLFAIFILASTVLFTTVLWSKFAHMFFKPAAAYQKKITKLDGSQENLPDVGDLSDPSIQARYPDIPEYMGTSPEYMGLGIKREAPNHY